MDDVDNGGLSEEITGRLPPKYFGMREEDVLATKVNGATRPGANGRGLSQRIMASIDAWLKRLGHDCVDLHQIHRWDDSTPIEETIGALGEVVRAGRARYIGASSMFAWQFAQAQRVAATPFVPLQNLDNLIYREEEREMIPQCIDRGVGAIPWSPLARRMLAGNRGRGGEQHTTRAETDAFAERPYKPELDRPLIDTLTRSWSVAGPLSRRVAELRRERV